MVNILIADDHRIFAQGLAILLTQADSNWQVIKIAYDGAEALTQIFTLRPDLAILDLAMPKINGLQVIRELAAAQCTTRLLILSMYDDSALIEQTRQAGANGYLLKENAFEQLINTVRMVLGKDGEWITTPHQFQQLISTRERQVLQYIINGQINRDIAFNMGLSIKTVETYRARLMRKLNAHNTAQLLSQAQLMGIAPIIVKTE